MDLKDTMMLYGVTLGSRKTQRKKNLCIETIKDTCEKLEVPFSIVQSKAGMFTVSCIVMGNLSEADYVVMAGLDTPAQYFTGLKQYPFHPEKSSRAENIKNILRLVSVIVLACMAYVPLLSSVSQGVKLWSVLTLVILFAGIVFVLFPKANPYNFSKSSSVAVLMKLMEECKDNTHIAYVLCDHTSSGYIGYKAVKEKISAHCKVILLGPVASGSKTVVAYKETDSQLGEVLSECISSSVLQRKYTEEESERNCLSLFPHCIYIGCGDIENKEFVVKDTACKKDVNVDMERLQKILNGLVRGIGDE